MKASPPVDLGHCEFRTVRHPDGWRAECKSCDWVGAPQMHPLDCGEDLISHSKETA